MAESKGRAILVAAGALLGACAASDPKTSPRLLDQYEQPGFLTGFCRWNVDRTMPVERIHGTFLMADEHAPDSLALVEGEIPIGIPRGIYPIAYPKGQRSRFTSQLYAEAAGKVEVSGKLAFGDVTCPGNFSSASFSGVLLLDRLH